VMVNEHEQDETIFEVAANRIISDPF